VVWYKFNTFRRKLLHPSSGMKTTTTPWLLVRTRTIPTERPPLVGEVSANFCGYRVSRGQRNGFLRPLISSHVSNQLSTCFLLVSCFTFFPTIKMEAVRSFETSVNGRQTMGGGTNCEFYLNCRGHVVT
jgi:hypothetical protein